MVTVNASGFVWMIMLVLVVVFILLFWLEWRRKMRFRNLRLIALLIVMIALAGLFLQPGYTKERSNAIALLTPGFSPASVDSLLTLENDLTLLHAPGMEAFRKSEELASYSMLQQHGSAIRFVLGEGLPHYALDLIAEKNYEFIQGNIPDGIIELYARTPTRSGRDNIVKGIYNNPQNETWLYLEGPGGMEDSVVVNGSGRQSFRLSFYPKQAGNYLYSIISKSSEEEVHREKFPIVVEKPEPLAILFIQSYPTFETQTLKNFLASHNHQVTLRSRLSRDRYRYEYLNAPPRTITTLNQEVLTAMDLLILDGDAALSLSRSEVKALRDAIRNGLGLLVVPDRISGKDTNPLFPFTVNEVRTDTALFYHNDQKLSLPAIPVRVKQSSSVVPLLESSNGLLSGYSFEGAGKIGFQLLQQTYRLSLSGDSILYSQLWAPLLEDVARMTRAETKVEELSPFPLYPDSPIAISLISGKEDIMLMADSLRIPLHEDVLLDGIWSATFPAGQPGWHELRTNDGNGIQYYISEQDEWTALNKANQLRTTLAYAKKPGSAVTGKSTIQKEIDPLIFYLMFLVSAGCIWLLPKL